MPQEILYSKTDNWTFLQIDSKHVTFFFAAASAFFFSAQLVFSFPQCKIIFIGNSCSEYICNVWIIQRNWFISTIIGVNLIHFNLHKINLQPTSWSASQNWTKPKWSFSKTSHCSSKVEIEILLTLLVGCDVWYWKIALIKGFTLFSGNSVFQIFIQKWLIYTGLHVAKIVEPLLNQNKSPSRAPGICFKKIHRFSKVFL